MKNKELEHSKENKKSKASQENSLIIYQYTLLVQVGKNKFIL